MGCCLSTSSSSNSSFPNRAPPPPPPPLLEEESVKEVLSETPKPKPLTHQLNHLSGVLGISNHPTQKISDLSQVSTFTQTLSTTTITEKMDDFQHIPHRISRSPANRRLSHDSLPRRDTSVGKSPSRKPDHSPGRIHGGALKLVQSRDVGRSLRPDPRLHNRTESSYRRSRSPATTRTDGVLSRAAAGRSPSVWRSGMSPGRDYCRKEAAQVKAAETNESLDNPLVSLECFIFL